MIASFSMGMRMALAMNPGESLETAISDISFIWRQHTFLACQAVGFRALQRFVRCLHGRDDFA